MGDFLKRLFGVFTPVVKETAKALVTLQADTLLRQAVADLRAHVESEVMPAPLQTVLLLDIDRIEVALTAALTELSTLTSGFVSSTGSSGAGSDEG